MDKTQHRSLWPAFRRGFLWSLAAWLLAASFSFVSAAPPVGDDSQWQVVIRPGGRPAAEVAVNTLAAADDIEQIAYQPPSPPMPEPPAPEPVAEPAPQPEAAPAVKSHTVSEAAEVVETQFGDWTVTIAPLPAKGSLAINGLKYDEVYASVPYRRAEYLANPGYRHEATMEILFGQLRPKTVVSHYEPRVVPTPRYSVYKPYRYSQTELNYLHGPAAYSFGQYVTPFYPAYPRYPMLY